MIITLNNFTLNNTSGTTNYTYLDEPIDGLGLPPIRSSTGNYSGRDGGYVGAQFYSARLITLTGRIFAPDVATLDTIRQNLAAALSTGSVTMYVTTNSGKQFLINCDLDSLDLPIQKAPLQQSFKISLIAADPNIYDNTTSGAMSTSLQLAVGGGITWPMSWPITWAPGAQPAVVNNTGQVLIYPVITLFTPNVVTTNLVANPSLEAGTTGWFGLTGSETLSQSTTQAYSGTNSLKVVTTGTASQGAAYQVSGLTGGKTVTVSAYAYVPSGVSFSVLFDQFNGTTYLTTSGGGTVAGTGSWQRVTATGTLQASCTALNLYVSTSSATTFYIDAVQAEYGNSASAYFDGNTANTSSATYAWTASANVSTSTRTLIGTSASSPSIKNVTTGQFFTLSGLTTQVGDIITIDMYNRTVLLNGGSILPFLTTQSTWWGLVPGNNSINLTSNNSTDTVAGTISWRSAYRSL